MSRNVYRGKKDLDDTMILTQKVDEDDSVGEVVVQGLKSLLEVVMNREKNLITKGMSLRD